MDTVQFRTNLKCDGCVSKVTPSLNALDGITTWSVDLKTADRVLTISGDHPDEKAVIQSLETQGYQAEKI